MKRIRSGFFVVLNEKGTAGVAGTCRAVSPIKSALSDIPGDAQLHSQANAPLANFDPFYEAFEVKEGDKMYKPENERVRIW